MNSLVENIFSVKRHKDHKIITFLGFKIKYKSVKKLSLQKQMDIIYTQLLFTKRIINDINYKQNLIFDYYLEAKNAKRATGELRQRQLYNIELLKEFVRICDKYSIDYWLDYGSLLGAVRHGGFVPWDNDLDVSMTHENIEKFRTVVDAEINPKYKYKFILTCYNRLVFSEDNGAFLDIYEYSSDNNRYRLGEKNPGFKADFFSTPEDILFPLKTIKFEDLIVKCPNNLDTYLRIKYGNYELLPKQSHMVPGHNSIEEYKIYYPEEAKRCKK